MKKQFVTYFGLVLLLVFCYSSVQAQETSEVDSYKIAFITQRLDLSSADAEKFWPIYNKHNKRYRDLKHDTWEPIKKDLDNIDNLTEKESEDLLERYRAYRAKRLQYREDFINELLTVISPKKVMQLKKADYDFNKELLKQIKTE